MNPKRLLVTAVALMLGVAPSVQAGVLCRLASGTIAARAECLPSETQVDPAALGLQGLPGPSLVVRDVNGTDVGLVVHPAQPFDRRTVVARRVGTVLVLLDLRGNGFLPSLNQASGDITLYFESVDCTGQALLDDYEIFIANPLAVQARVVGGTAYFVDPAVPRSTWTVASYQYAPVDEGICVSIFGGVFSPPHWCCTGQSSSHPPPPGFTLDLSPAVMLDLAPFVPPFRIEGR